MSPSSATPRVSLTRASFGYRGRAVVADVNLELGDGDFLAVLGRNGSGKTTLLRGLLGLIEPLGGRVDQRDVRFGYVPQRETLDAVFPLTVEEVVRMGAYARLGRLRRLGKGERAQAESALERVQLDGLRRELFSSLSGGQRQRVLIARALLTQPNVLVLDEPTSGVDTPTAERLLEFLTQLNHDEGLAIVIVSHQIGMMRTVREVLWVGDGRVRQGSSREMLAPERLEQMFGVSFRATGSPAGGRGSA